MDISQYFVSLAVLIPLIILITDFLVRWLKIEKSWVKQVLSWGVSLILCAVGVTFDLGMFAGVPTYHFVLYGLGVGLVSNGIFDINVVQMLLDFIFKLLPKQQ